MATPDSNETKISALEGRVSKLEKELKNLKKERDKEKDNIKRELRLFLQKVKAL